MKVRYLTEAVFKNPAQARAAREKEKEISNVDRIANLSSNVISRQIETKLNEYLTCFDEDRWYSDNDMEKAGRHIFNHIRVLVLYFIKEFDSYNNKLKIEFRITPKGEDVIYDIFVSPGKTMYNVFYAPVKTEMRIAIGPMKSHNYYRKRVEAEIERYIGIAAQYDVELNPGTKSQASQYILDKLASNNLKLNKIHLFEGSKADYYFILDYNRTLAKEVLSAQSYMWGLQQLTDLFSLDNDGKDIIIASERNVEKEKIIISLDKLSELTGDNSPYDIFFDFIKYISDYKNLDNSYSSNPQVREDWYNSELAPYAKKFPETVKNNPEFMKYVKFFAFIAPTKYTFDITDEPKQIKSIPHVLRAGFVLTSAEGKFYDKPFSWDTNVTDLINFTRSHHVDNQSQEKTSAYTVTFDFFIFGLYLEKGKSYGSNRLTDEDRAKIKAKWDKSRKDGINSYSTVTLFTYDNIVKRFDNVIDTIREANSVMPKRLAKPLTRDQM